MEITRALALRLLRRQDWGEAQRSPGRPSALSALRERRSAPALRQRGFVALPRRLRD